MFCWYSMSELDFPQMTPVRNHHRQRPKTPFLSFLERKLMCHANKPQCHHRRSMERSHHHAANCIEWGHPSGLQPGNPWLNSLPAVFVLLTGGPEAVEVDGMDTNRATPGTSSTSQRPNLLTCGCQLSFGARLDSRDANHRTPILFSLPHSQILWLCEMVLRLHRWQDFKASYTLANIAPTLRNCSFKCRVRFSRRHPTWRLYGIPSRLLCLHLILWLLLLRIRYLFGLRRHRQTP
jgi:hypothetical protein